MATITPTDISGQTVTVTQTTMTSSDTFTFNPQSSQVLIFNNGTGGSLTVNIDGANSTSVTCPGVGTVDVSGGFDVVVADGTEVAVNVGSISEYLKGPVTLTGGTGIEASLLER